MPVRFARWRIVVFSCSFILACAISLSYVYTQPAEYRAVARLQISPAGIVPEASDTSPALQHDPQSFLIEVQVLTSRPLLEEVVKRIKDAGRLPNLGPDPIDAVQRMLRAEPVDGTQIVQLSAASPWKMLVSDLVNTIGEVYRERVAESYKNRAASTYADVSDEARALRNDLLAKQHAVDAFRERYEIVSLDRKENDVLSKIDGLGRSFAESNEQLAKAQGRLEAVRNSVAAGKVVVRAKDDPTLANLEQRASALREQRRDLERRYTAEYLARDVDATAMQARISNLDQQLKEQRAASQQAAIVEAEDEFSSSQAAVNRLRKDLDDNQKVARQFAARLAEFKVMQEDLDHLQSMERAVVDRSTKLQASERERAPRIELLELAAPSLEPWRPKYNLDALLSLAGSLTFALFATWLAGFLRGPMPQPAVAVHHSLSLPPMLHPASPLRSFSAPSPVQLPAPDPMPRELDDTEIARLLSNAPEDLRLVVTALLLGLSPMEIVTLRWDQIDFTSRLIKIEGEFSRTVRLEPLVACLSQWHRDMPECAALILQNGRSGSITVEDLNRLILYGAYDAGLDRPNEVTAAALRHTYLVFLLRQGIRATDIGRIAGHVPENDMIAYMQLAVPRARLPFERIDYIHPALRVPVTTRTNT